MKSFFSVGAAMVLAAATFVQPASSAPMAPGAIQAAVNDGGSSIVDVRYHGGGGGGPHYRPPHGGGGNWHGGGRPGNWHGGGRPPGYRGSWHGYPGYRGGYYGGRPWAYRNGYGWGYWPLAGAVIAAPYVANNCGYVNVRRWVNGRQVWVRKWRCL